MQPESARAPFRPACETRLGGLAADTAQAGRELSRPLGYRRDRRPSHRHCLERLGQTTKPTFDRGDPIACVRRHRAPLEPPRGTRERIGRLANRDVEFGDQRVQIRCVRRIRSRRRAGVARKLGELTARDLHSEEPGRDIGDLVRFIDDQGIGEREQIPESGLLERHVREQEMVVDHHDIRFGRPAPCLDDVASIVHRTLRSQAVVRGGGDRAPNRVMLGKVGHFGEVTIPGSGHPSRQARHPRRQLPRDQTSGGQHLLVAPAAEVVRSTLEQGNPRGASQGLAGKRQIAFEQPVLQMAGTGRNHDPTSAGNGGHKVCESLAGARSGFTDEGAPPRDGPFHRPGHGLLVGAGGIAGEQSRQGSVDGKHVLACGLDVQRSCLPAAAIQSVAGTGNGRCLAQDPARGTAPNVTTHSILYCCLACTTPTGLRAPRRAHGHSRRRRYLR